MRILEILETIRDQVFQILSERKCNVCDAVNMLKRYFLVARHLDIAHTVNIIKLLEIILLYITMSSLTSSAYKYISLALLLITFSLIIYIIITEFFD